MNRRWQLALIISAFAALGVGSAVGFVAAPNIAGLQTDDASYMPDGAPTLVPYGWIGFCREQPAECESARLEPAVVNMTAQSWAELKRINTLANQQIEPIGDEDHYRIYELGILNWWTYPDDGKGNCNDYVILKRRLLIEAGWPKAALFMTVVRDLDDSGHLVLIARTDRGDLVLDNMRWEIVRWDQTGYRFIKRQSEFDHVDWVSIQPPETAWASAAGTQR